METNKKLKQFIVNEINNVLKEHESNDIVTQDFKKNFAKVKKLGQNYDNIVDQSFSAARIKELKVDLFNMYLNSLDSQTKAKYSGISEVNALKIADALITFYRKNKTAIKF